MQLTAPLPGVCAAGPQMASAALPRCSRVPHLLPSSQHSCPLPSRRLRSARLAAAKGQGIQLALGHDRTANRACPRATAAPAVHVEPPPFAQEFPGVPSLEVLAQLAGPPVVPDRLAHAKKRFFGASDEERAKLPDLLLYRDDAAWCPYCERVWIQLEEKRIPYRVEKVNLSSYGPKPDWFLEMVPSGRVPVIKLGDKIITESLEIMKAIEEAFPHHSPLVPTEPSQQQKVEELLQLDSKLAFAWAQWARAPPPGQGAEEPHGPEGAPDAGQLKQQFLQALEQLEGAIRESGGPFFLGQKFSLLDAVFAPFIERVSANALYWQGFRIRHSSEWPFLSAWIDAMDAKPYYKAMKSDDYTLNRVITYIGKFAKHPEGERYRAKVEGDGEHWSLPLKPEETAWGFDDGTGVNRAKAEAAQALLGNHMAVVNFSLRAFDIKAVDAPEKAAHVSAALRHVAQGLLQGVDAAGHPPDGIDQAVALPALVYLRDRIGVPRDLTYPAARQLRAHLHRYITSF